MLGQWAEHVEGAVLFLRQAGVDGSLDEYSDGTPTAADAARAVGCELGQIVKSLVFDCDGRALVVLVPGDRRADPQKVASAAGCSRLAIANPPQVEAATGFAPGAVAPFPLPRVERVFVERSLLAHEAVWIGAGSTRHMAAVPTAELVRLARAEPMDAVQDAPYHSP